MPLKNSIVFLYIALVLSMVAWAGSWVSAKMISNIAPAQIISFYRLIMTAISLLPLLLLSKRQYVFHWKSVLYITLGAIFTSCYTILFFYGLKAGLAGASGVLVTTMVPLFTAFLASILFKQAQNMRGYLGLIIGVIAGFIMVQPWQYDAKTLWQSTNLLFLFAAFIWGCLTITSQKAQQYMSSITFTFYGQLLSAIFIFLMVMSKQDTNLMDAFQLPVSFWLHLIFLSAIVTAIATTIYFYCAKTLGSKQASSFTYLVPISAALLSFIFLNEIPTIPTIIGGILAILAVYLVNSAKKLS